MRWINDVPWAQHENKESGMEREAEALAAWPLTPPVESWWGAQPLSTLISWVVILSLRQMLATKAGHALRGEEATVSTLCSEIGEGLPVLIMSWKQTCFCPCHPSGNKPATTNNISCSRAALGLSWREAHSGLIQPRKMKYNNELPFPIWPFSVNHHGRT